MDMCDHLLLQVERLYLERIAGVNMLVQQKHTDIPLFDTTAIHAEAAVAKALG